MLARGGGVTGKPGQSGTSSEVCVFMDGGGEEKAAKEISPFVCF